MKDNVIFKDGVGEKQTRPSVIRRHIIRNDIEKMLIPNAYIIFLNMHIILLCVCVCEYCYCLFCIYIFCLYITYS